MGYVRNFAQFLQKSFILKMFLFGSVSSSVSGAGPSDSLDMQI